MDRNIFNKQMELNLPETACDFEEMLNNKKNLVQRSINMLDDGTVPRGFNNLIILFEEFAELQKELTNDIRGKGDRNGILEELADVFILLQNVIELYNFTDEEIDKALYIKLKRLSNRLDENDYK